MSNSKIPVSWLALALVVLLLPAPAGAQPRKQAKDARATVNRFFALLKAGQYAALYDFLPAQFQQQVTREQLTFSLKRLESFITIERLVVGRVQERGDYAVVDTTIYGRLKKPLTSNGQELKEGRVLAQQYLFRENGQWKLASADNRAQSFFLKRNPDFDKQFQLAPPRFEFKQDGAWKAAGGRPR